MRRGHHSDGSATFDRGSRPLLHEVDDDVHAHVGTDLHLHQWIVVHGEGIGLICGRPHAQGGGLSFPSYLASRFDVRTLEDSAQRLCALVDASPPRRLIFTLRGKQKIFWL